MYPFQRILIPTDFSLCAERAYQHALFLAERYRAEVHLLYVASAAEAGGNGAAAQMAVWPGRSLQPPEQLPPFVASWHGLSVRREVVYHDDPVVAILEYANAQEVDLIVMGAHGDRGAGHFLSVGSAFLGRTAEQVVRHAKCPVFRIVMRNGDGPEEVRRLLVAVDGSELSVLALAYAKDLASFYRAHLDLLQVIETRPRRGGEEEASDSDVSSPAQARSALVALFEQASGAETSARFHVVEGRPDREIRAFAKRNDVDVVVLGAHSDLGRDVLGNVAEQVVRTAPAPVLTVRKTEDELIHTAGSAPASSKLC